MFVKYYWVVIIVCTFTRVSKIMQKDQKSKGVKNWCILTFLTTVLHQFLHSKSGTSFDASFVLFFTPCKIGVEECNVFS